MNQSRVALFCLVMTSLGAGVWLGRMSAAPVVQAQSSTKATSFVPTAALDLPGPNELSAFKGKALRLEDKEYGIVCYIGAPSGFPLGCVKK